MNYKGFQFDCVIEDKSQNLTLTNFDHCVKLILGQGKHYSLISDHY